MNTEFFMATEMLAEEKGIPVEYLCEKISTALVAAIRRNYSGKDIVFCDIDSEKQTMRVYVRKEVVEDVTDSDSQLTVEAAAKYNKNAKPGDFVDIDLDTMEFGRIAAQTAKHVIRQGIRDAERTQQIEAFRAKTGEIVSAKVVRVDPSRGNVSLEIGRSDAMLPLSQQVPGESFYEGEMIKVYIVDVKDTEKGSRVMLSRTHPEFVRRLFENEVPEIFDGTIEIKSVSREAGSRTKIAVYSANEDVDPVGACIGPKGARVNAVVDVLGGEKIDIVEYSEDPAQFIAAALAPAEVADVVIVSEEERACKVAVPDSQLSLGIGNKGQNARLAAKLTGWKIDIKALSVFYDEPEEEEPAAAEEAPETEEE